MNSEENKEKSKITTEMFGKFINTLSVKEDIENK